jgi:hypothetical protein
MTAKLAADRQRRVSGSSGCRQGRTSGLDRGIPRLVVHVLVFVIAALVAAAMWGLIPLIIRRGRDGR